MQSQTTYSGSLNSNSGSGSSNNSNSNTNSNSNNNSNNNSGGGGGSNSTSSGRFLYIKDLEPNQKAINLHVIVLEVTRPNTTKDGNEVRTVRIADKTGSINLSVWNEHGSVLRDGDILRLNGCFTQVWKNSLQVKISNKGQIIKCGDFMMTFNESLDMSILSPDILKNIQDQSKPSNNNNNNNISNNNNKAQIF